MSEVVSIHTTSERGVMPHEVQSIEAVAGAGLRGDYRYAVGAPPERHLTLIESEELERLAAEHSIELVPGESRRQLTTRGVRLNPLVGRRFMVGAVECRGIELCEPCMNLERWTQPGIMRAMVHRAGLNAEIVTGGEIGISDAISPLED